MTGIQLVIDLQVHVVIDVIQVGTAMAGFQDTKSRQVAKYLEVVCKTSSDSSAQNFQADMLANFSAAYLQGSGRRFARAISILLVCGVTRIALRRKHWQCPGYIAVILHSVGVVNAN